MELNLDFLRPQERLSLQLRQLYENAGFRHYHMSRFEEYGLYQQNRRFLADEQVLSFTDLDGRLMALKPDVTLSIAKNAQVEQGSCGRFYYLENVYRPSQESHTFQEISQMGLECIGAVDDAAAAQVVSLADVYDALSCKRVYKDAFPRQQVLDMIREGQCGTFNPKLLECFFAVEERLHRLYEPK